MAYRDLARLCRHPRETWQIQARHQASRQRLGDRRSLPPAVQKNSTGKTTRADV